MPDRGYGPQEARLGRASEMSRFGGGPEMPRSGGGPEMSRFGGGPEMPRAEREATFDAERIRSIGWTLIELLLALSIVGVLAAIAVPAIGDAHESRRVTQAIADIRSIEAEIASFAMISRRPPADLGEIGWAGIEDPWGRPYRYLRFDGIDWAGRARVDRFDVPINSTYDLYSVGRDGRTALSLQLPQSWDDVIRANDGVYVGLASRF